MADQPHTPGEKAPDASEIGADPSALRDSLERTGRYLKKAGLPFDTDEFDDESSAADVTPQSPS